MLYNRYYELESDHRFEETFKSIDLVFTGNSSEIRSQKVISLIEEFYTGSIYSINYEMELEKYSIVSSTKKISYRKEDLSANGKNLMFDFEKDLRKLDIDGKVILIDITSLKHPLLFYFLYLLRNNFTPKKLFLTYTEPEEYVQQKIENVTKKFDLTEKFCSVKPLPGFLRISDHNKQKLLVALMGFEGNRFSKAFEDINPSTRKTYAIVGFPSFQPGWQYYVYSENQNPLEQSKAYLLIKRATANEPFSVYNILTDIKKNNSDFEINLAPIGTKPHSLGACMFAIDNTDVQIYYDFPAFGDKKRTIGVGTSFLYNLTDFINE
jgi:hypothetical protein